MSVEEGEYINHIINGSALLHYFQMFANENPLQIISHYGLICKFMEKNICKCFKAIKLMFQIGRERLYINLIDPVLNRTTD